mmetsp:Transcript_72809/g.210798  ORF Transcript_72809/g.210798 Transcript_72809/m.210798 type:complete len:270 (+) Transcript_72809:1822-2631(+)
MGGRGVLHLDCDGSYERLVAFGEVGDAPRELAHAAALPQRGEAIPCAEVVGYFREVQLRGLVVPCPQHVGLCRRVVRSGRSRHIHGIADHPASPVLRFLYRHMRFVAPRPCCQRVPHRGPRTGERPAAKSGGGGDVGGPRALRVQRNGSPARRALRRRLVPRSALGRRGCAVGDPRHHHPGHLPAHDGVPRRGPLPRAGLRPAQHRHAVEPLDDRPRSDSGQRHRGWSRRVGVCLPRSLCGAAADTAVDVAGALDGADDRTISGAFASS